MKMILFFVAISFLNSCKSTKSQSYRPSGGAFSSVNHQNINDGTPSYNFAGESPSHSMPPSSPPPLPSPSPTPNPTPNTEPVFNPLIINVNTTPGSSICDCLAGYYTNTVNQGSCNMTSLGGSQFSAINEDGQTAVYQCTDNGNNNYTLTFVGNGPNGGWGGSPPSGSYAPTAISWSNNGNWSQVTGACMGLTPPPPPGSCGDGILNAGEQCDDGNLNNGDSCSSTCQITGCGNGVVEAQLGEQCDLGAGLNIPGSGCNSCRMECTLGEHFNLNRFVPYDSGVNLCHLHTQNDVKMSDLGKQIQLGGLEIENVPIMKNLHAIDLDVAIKDGNNFKIYIGGSAQFFAGEGATSEGLGEVSESGQNITYKLATARWTFQKIADCGIDIYPVKYVETPSSKQEYTYTGCRIDKVMEVSQPGESQINYSYDNTNIWTGGSFGPTGSLAQIVVSSAMNPTARTFSWNAPCGPKAPAGVTCAKTISAASYKPFGGSRTFLPSIVLNSTSTPNKSTSDYVYTFRRAGNAIKDNNNVVIGWEDGSIAGRGVGPGQLTAGITYTPSWGVGVSVAASGAQSNVIYSWDRLAAKKGTLLTTASQGGTATLTRSRVLYNPQSTYKTLSITANGSRSDYEQATLDSYGNVLSQAVQLEGQGTLKTVSSYTYAYAKFGLPNLITEGVEGPVQSKLTSTWTGTYAPFYLIESRTGSLGNINYPTESYTYETFGSRVMLKSVKIGAQPVQTYTYTNGFLTRVKDELSGAYTDYQNTTSYPYPLQSALSKDSLGRTTNQSTYDFNQSTWLYNSVSNSGITVNSQTSFAGDGVSSQRSASSEIKLNQGNTTLFSSQGNLPSLEFPTTSGASQSSISNDSASSQAAFAIGPEGAITQVATSGIAASGQLGTTSGSDSAASNILLNPPTVLISCSPLVAADCSALSRVGRTGQIPDGCTGTGSISCP